MESLPGHLLDKVFFGIDPRSLGIIRCTNTSLKSHIYDPVFESEYFSRIGSGLLHAYGSSLLYYNPPGDSRSLRTKHTLTRCNILGSCSGLLLLFIDDYLCVANPLTKKFRFLNQNIKFDCSEEVRRDKRLFGFAVNQIDRTTQSFKVVHMIDGEKFGKYRYSFRINDGNSWKLSKTTITCDSSELDNRMRNPVYLNGSLYWLRYDGNIVAFNPETEQARLIPIKFPQVWSLKEVFAASDTSLTLISATKEVIYVYALENILSDPKWVLVRKIRNGVLDEKRLNYWDLEAYDGKCLVLREDSGHVDRVVHVSANKWVVIWVRSQSGPMQIDICFSLHRPSLVW